LKITFFFLEQLHKRLKNKYQNIEIEKADSLLLENFFPFIDYVTIRFRKYEVKLDSFHWKLFSIIIVEIFESHQFETNEIYNRFNFNFDHKTEPIELVERFENVTDDLLRTLQTCQKKHTTFFRKTTPTFK